LFFEKVFQKCDYDDQKEGITLYCLLFVAFGIVSFIGYLLQGSMFGFSGENLTRRLRSLTFEKMLAQEVAWFDSPTNDVGTLSTRLAVDAAAVQGATGIRIGFMLMNFGNLGVGLCIAFAYSWVITLLIFGFLPFVIVSGILQSKMLTGFSGKDKKILEEAGQVGLRIDPPPSRFTHACTHLVVQLI
jgi:ABC-type multidrug transport system fused ATPase/permease subunit